MPLHRYDVPSLTLNHLPIPIPDDTVSFRHRDHIAQYETVRTELRILRRLCTDGGFIYGGGGGVSIGLVSG